MLAKLRKFITCRRGVGAIEFAIWAPLLLMVSMGGVETSNYVYMKKKGENAAYNIINILNQLENISLDQLNSIVNIVPQVMEPFKIDSTQYRIIVTCAQRDLDSKDATGKKKPYVHWQYGFGAPSLGSSKFNYNPAGKPADNILDTAKLNGFSFVAGDQVLIVESFFNYQSLIGKQTADAMLGEWATKFENLITARPRKGSFQFKPDQMV